MATRYFHWDAVDDCVMHETDDGGATTVEYTHEPGQFGPLLSETRSGVESYHHYDALGSTTALSDPTGAVTDTFQYDAWGNQVVRTGTTPTPYTWVGRWGYQHDAPTGGYYIRVRSYLPTVARWMSVDPLLTITRNTAFGFVNNCPIIYVDPSGLECHGPPNGVVSFLDRGKFRIFSLRPYVYDRYDIASRRGSSFLIKWGWNFDPNPFMDPCCCCTSVGFLQIVRNQYIYAKSFLGASDSGWIIDGTIPYHVGTPSDNPKANPCEGAESIQISDQPNALEYAPPAFLWFQRLLYLSHEFETCAVCLEGNEGIVREEQGQLIDGITVYGCIRFGHSIEWLPDIREYRYHRYVDAPFVEHKSSIGDRAAINRPSLQFPGNFTGASPTPQFAHTAFGYVGSP